MTIQAEGLRGRMKMAMFVPFQEPCGIGDYTRRMTGAFPAPVALLHDPQELWQGAWDLVHVQYEPGLFRKGRESFFPEVMASVRGRKVVTAHEVYDRNPFIFPRPEGSGFLNFLKGTRWDLCHRLERKEEAFAPKGFFADAVVVHTREAKDILMKKSVPPEKVSVFPMPVVETAAGDRRRGRKLFSLPEKKTCLVFGFLSSANDYDLLLDAAAGLTDNTLFLIAGGPRRKEDRPVEVRLHDEIRRRGLVGRVRALGFVESGRLPDLFACADVFLNVSRVKSASAGLAHGLGARLPALAPDLPCFREIREETACVKLYAPGDRGSLLEALASLFDEKENQSRREAAQAYCSRHSLAGFVEEHWSLYRRLLESRH